jgi:hypothetical protein
MAKDGRSACRLRVPEVATGEEVTAKLDHSPRRVSEILAQ